MSTTNTSPRPVSAKFLGAPSKPAEIVTDLRQIVNNAQKAPDWTTSPQVQAAINTLAADAGEIEQRAILIDQLHKKLVEAKQAQAEKLVACKQHRKHAEATITVASQGSVGGVKAWGCVVARRTTSTPTDEAPQNVLAKNARTPGHAVVRCKGARAQAYVFQQADEPTFPAGSPAPVVLSSATYHVTGLSPGQKIYFRVAVIRPVVGQSKWSEPVQLTVR
jgi:hypothetical protein